MLPAIRAKLVPIIDSSTRTIMLELHTTKDENTRYNVFNFKDAVTGEQILNFKVTEQTYGVSVIDLISMTGYPLPSKQKPCLVVGGLSDKHISYVKFLDNNEKPK